MRPLELPSDVEPHSVGFVELRYLDFLVLETQIQAIEYVDADTGAIDEILAAFIDDAAARQIQIDVVEHHADAAEQLDRTDRQRADDAWRQALHIGRARSRWRDEAARLAEVNEVGLHGEEPIEVPAAENFRGVVAIAEIDADIVELVEL